MQKIKNQRKAINHTIHMQASQLREDWNNGGKLAMKIKESENICEEKTLFRNQTNDER